MREALAEEVRRLVVQCCCAAGGLAGLWLGFWAALAEPGTDSSLTTALVPVGWRVTAGVLAGACLAALCIRAIPWLRAAHDPAPRR